MAKLNIGIIGGGMVSEAHFQAFTRMPEARITGLADPNLDAAMGIAGRYGVDRVVANYRELLEDSSLDLVVICTPHFLHRPIALDAFAAGKHVICEKPIAMNLAEADEMIAAAQAANKELFIALNHRFLPANRKAKKALEAGRIGRPFLCAAQFIGNELDRMNDPVNWKCTPERAGGGVLIDSGTHMVDMLNLFFGEVESLTAAGGRLACTAENKAEDTAILSLNFKSGVMANLTLSFAVRHNLWFTSGIGCNFRFDIYGTEGSIHVSNQPGDPLIIVRDDHVERVKVWDQVVDEDEHFVHCLLEDVKPRVTALDARKAMEVVMAAYESIRGEGKRIYL
ncbi:MAG: Gfo/Idh/MocA family oxidoreductase [Candidatus Latescibacterota bacterium]